MLRLVLHPAGLALLRDGEVMWGRPAPEDPSEAADFVSSVLRGELPRELVELVEELREEGGRITLCFQPRSPISELAGMPVRIDPASCREIRARYRELAASLGVGDYLGRVSSTAAALASLGVREELGRMDLLVARAVDYLDHLNRSLNLLIPAIREWYSIHFPEMDSTVEDHGLYAKLIVELGDRREICEGGRIRNLVPREVADKIRSAACRSMGADLGEEDLGIVREVTRRWLDLYESREKVEDYLRRLLPKVAPNLTAVLGPLVAARLIATAGGLEKLAAMPASTIQILGAQRAVFLHLTRGTRPPKHGVLFQAKEVRTAPKKLRGKIARLLASKAAIAARIDFFGGGRYEGDRLRREVDEKLAKIRREGGGGRSPHEG